MTWEAPLEQRLEEMEPHLETADEAARLGFLRCHVAFASARLARSLGALLSMGVPICDALDACASAFWTSFEAPLRLVSQEVSRGGTLGAVLDSPMSPFPPLLGQAVAAAEPYGTVLEALARLGDHYAEISVTLLERQVLRSEAAT